MNTFSAKPAEVKRSWYIVDAKGKNLGRMASRVAAILRGKHKPEFTPHVDTGDFVIIVNAAEAAMSGKKSQDKQYYRHSQYPGGLTAMSYSKLLEKHPTRPFELAIKGMLPKNSLGRAMFSKLKVYPGAEHPHTAQQPEILEVLS
ncbi:MAG TPA: 50S ribosomal protein L13 [Gammaproteobacteria bacterium]|nr:50S ribosomal protein L13 [Gammaproteobacteria bacterium]